MTIILSVGRKAHLARLPAQEVVALLQQNGEGRGGVVVLHGGHVIVADLHEQWEVHGFVNKA